MSNAASFNLLQFVEQRPALSAKKILFVIILWVALLLGYFLFQTQQVRHAAGEIAKMELTLQQLTQTLQPLLQQGEKNPLVGVLSSNVLKGEQPFYPEFEALSHVRVKGLWLNDVVIKRNPAFIKMTGAMDSPDKLNPLLQQLSAQPAFKNIQFIGVDVSKGLLPDVPEQYRAAIKQLKIPTFYHFVIQTTALNKQGAQL